MFKGQEVYRSVQLTDDIQTSSLGVMDQIRLIVANMSNDDAAELDKNEKLSVDKLSKIASLSDFLEKAIKKMREQEKNSVTVKLASEYKPFFNEVFNDKGGYGRYYDFVVLENNIPLHVKHFIVVRISKKKGIA